jgi:hypothetical protein
MNKNLILKTLLIFVTVMLIGCSSSYTLRVVDEQAQEIYLEFSKGEDVKVGDVFALYHYRQPQSTGGHQGHSGGGQLSLKELVGYVQVTRLVDEQLAEVKVLSGNVHRGAAVEKVKQ